jgi:nitrogen fixation protein NifT
MKVMVNRKGDVFQIYVAKKDLEEPIVESEKPGLWGGWVQLGNGWRLELPDLPVDTRLPITVEARKLADA